MRNALPMLLAAATLASPGLARGEAARWLTSGSLSGSMRTRLQYDWGRTTDPTNDAFSDADWIQDVRLRGEGTGHESLTTGLWFRYEKDLDGTAPDSPFIDQRDAYSDRDDFKLFEAWAAVDDLPADIEVRVGRQFRFLVDPVHFDGGEVSVPTPLDGRALALVGRRVTFETDPDERLIAAGSWFFRPTDHTRVEISDLFYDRNQLDLYVNQDLSEEWNSTFELLLLDERVREVSVSALWLGFGGGGFEDRDRSFFASYLYKAATGAHDLLFDYTSVATLPDDADEQDRLLLLDLPPFHELLLEGTWTVARPWKASLGVTGSFLARVFEGSAGLDVGSADTVEGTLGVYLVNLFRGPYLDGLDITVLGTRAEIFLDDIPEDLTEADLSRTDGEGETGYWAVSSELQVRTLASRLNGILRIGYRFYDESRTRFLVARDVDGLDITAYLRWRPTEHLRVTAGYGFLEDLTVQFPHSVADDEFPTQIPDLVQVQSAFLDLTLSF